MLLVLVITLAVGARLPGQSDNKPNQTTGSADALFVAGQFDQAEKLYLEATECDPRDYHCWLRAGQIALLSNQFAKAEHRLQKAMALKPSEKTAREFLAESYVRRDEFSKASSLYEAAGQKALAQTMASFKGLTPYLIEGKGEETVVKWVASDPLPLVQVRINGGKQVTFFIDTGASVVTLDTDFAKELGITRFGSVEGTFAGGQKAAVENGKIDSLTLGNWEVKNLPVAIMPLRPLSKVLGNRQIDGILGTVLFYHFLTTLDYPNKQLILRRKNEQNLSQFEAKQGKDAVTIPFWMASSHFMITPARINGREPTLLFVDSGLAGAGVKLGDYAIKHDGVKLLEDQATESVGAAGKFRSVPFVLDSLSLGAAQQQKVKGYFEGPFPWEMNYGFRLVGMVGHEFLRHYVVTFDYDRMRITLRK